MDVSALFIAMGVPSAVTGFCFWLIEHRLQVRERKEQAERADRQKDVDEREQAREQNQYLLIKSVGAALALGEATARAVKRIPDAKCNGDMDAALNYATEIKHEQKDFLTRQGIKDLY
ncbi:MAG: serine/threonine protein kinase [Lachnospiraceae bacterium]|nr:serine/threonine protein kinase [Lachnospiraceae bacterium]